MSVQAIDWALRVVKNTTPTQKLILICLANYAGPDGTCWPSQSTLADYSGLSREAICRNLTELETRGFLQSICRRDTVGRDLPKSYRLLLSHSAEPSGETENRPRHNQSSVQTPEKVANSLGVILDHTPPSLLPPWCDPGSHLTKSTLSEEEGQKVANSLGVILDHTGVIQNHTEPSLETKTKKTTTTRAGAHAREPGTEDVVVSGNNVGNPGKMKPLQAKIPERTKTLPDGTGQGSDLLIQVGVSPRRAEILARKNGVERIRSVVEYAQSCRPANPPAFIALALKEGWRIPADVAGHENEADQYLRDLNKWNSLSYGQRSHLLRQGGWGGNSNYPSPSWLRETLSRIESRGS